MNCLLKSAQGQHANVVPAKVVAAVVFFISRKKFSATWTRLGRADSWIVGWVERNVAGRKLEVPKRETQTANPESHQRSTFVSKTIISPGPRSSRQLLGVGMTDGNIRTFVSKMQIICKIIVTNVFEHRQQAHCVLINRRSGGGKAKRRRPEVTTMALHLCEPNRVPFHRIHSPLDKQDVYIQLQCCKSSAMHSLSVETKGRCCGLANVLPWRSLLCFVLVLTLSGTAPAKIKPKATSPVSSNIELSATLADAVKAVEEVAADPILYGTYVYEHDKILIGAHAAEISSAFGNDKHEGKSFYKVLDGVIAPRHFKDSEDSGTITVRYIVRELTPATVSIRIDAVFVESARRASHDSQGAVESAEFGQVQLHLNHIQARAQEAEEERKAELAGDSSGSSVAGPEAPARVIEPPPAATEDLGNADSRNTGLGNAPIPEERAAASSPEVPSLAVSSTTPASSGSIAGLEQRVNQLRRQVEAVVKAPGAPLKSAPFHTATTIQTVPAKAEVAIIILTSYWYGVQTTDGHTGWIQRSQLEPLP